MARMLLQRGAFICVAGILACTDLGSLASGEDECAPPQTKVGDQCVTPDGGVAPIPKPPEGCPEGTQDNDNDDLCEPSCAKGNVKCGARAKCDDASGKATCICPVGYVLEADSNCAWRGGPKDPGFQNQPPSWTLTGGPVIEPTAPGKVDPGLARFQGDMLCNAEGSVSQKFPMPPFAEAEPFALEVSGSIFDHSFSAMAHLDGLLLDYVNLFTLQQPIRICFGERAYGHEVNLVLKNEIGFDCVPTSTVDLDHVAVVPAPSCPAVGTLFNGDFEGTGGWTVNATTNPAGATAEVASAVGSGGSRGGRIATSTRCQIAQLTGQISSPLASVTRPALSFTYKGSNGSTMTISGATAIGEVKGNATFQAAKICLPEHMKGFVTPLRFALPYVSGTCTDPLPREFVFDDIKIVDEPTCPAPAYVIDGGFESSGSASSWQLVPDSSNRPSGVAIDKVGQSHSGTAHAMVYTSSYCASVSIRQTISVPPSVGAAGPAVKFWYRAPFAINAGSISTAPGGTLTQTATWTQKTACIPTYAIPSGRFLFSVNAYGGSGNCNNTHGLERLEVDDVEVTTDPSCPTQ